LIRLLFSKCLPIFLYGLDACPTTKSHTRLLDFVVDRCFMKIFKTKSIDVVNTCQCNFNVQKASCVALNRKRRFLYACIKNDNNNNILKLLEPYARKELLTLS
jgi:hypothetical protein